MHNCTLQTGKLHFGVILGWSVVSSIVVWLVVNNMAGTENPESQSLGLYSCCCLLGYCLLPMVVFALLALIIPRYKLLPQRSHRFEVEAALNASLGVQVMCPCLHVASHESHSLCLFLVTPIMCACATSYHAQAQMNFCS